MLDQPIDEGLLFLGKLDFSGVGAIQRRYNPQDAVFAPDATIRQGNPILPEWQSRNSVLPRHADEIADFASKSVRHLERRELGPLDRVYEGRHGQAP